MVPNCKNDACIGGYCIEHYKQRARTRFRSNTNSNARGYNYRWQQFRKIYLMEHSICVICGQPATDVDHIKDHNGDKVLFWNEKNLQALCHSCHSKKTAKEHQFTRLEG